MPLCHAKRQGVLAKGVSSTLMVSLGYSESTPDEAAEQQKQTLLLWQPPALPGALMGGQ